MTAASRRELRLAGSPVVPRSGIAACALAEAPTLQTRSSGQLGVALQQSERALELPHACKQHRALQIHVRSQAVRNLLGAIELFGCSIEAVAPLFDLGKIDGRL